MRFCLVYSFCNYRLNYLSSIIRFLIYYLKIYQYNLFYPTLDLIINLNNKHAALNLFNFVCQSIDCQKRKKIISNLLITSCYCRTYLWHSFSKAYSSSQLFSYTCSLSCSYLAKIEIFKCRKSQISCLRTLSRR